MRIMSLNAWGGRVHDRLIPYLANADPDVLCLQEMVSTPTVDKEWLIYRDHDLELPQRANLLQEVAAALPSHQVFFCPAARGDLYDGNVGYPSEWGLTTFVRRTYPVIGQAQDFVHGEFSPDGWGEHPRSRNAHAVRLFDYETSSVITIAHMHGLRDPAGKGDTPARHVQARRFAELIDRTRRDTDRLVICGDFNVLPGSVTFAALAELGLTDLITTRGFTDTRTSLYKKTPRFADYMLISANVPIRHFDVVKEPEVSDHCALVLDIG
ncbi:endonuclease/exonuclease/phosphatase family metal-dependent hydrolase [Mesorhizobium soli]|uniref:endonuclease/exonuclease/phosphatase family protein n=1 Tax=Pseudaminobacter soli (ex Li et al. 2025) TaxID=1295366 RepID=UPI0024739355|nr:endonuclease/exonuclease/phosphatase family protein [Mesorhizobium soli]MDH6229946.1 endonuclease/exonuclease/phosphatase family metal-dependent hydrolase [Mesorhizobium soli]